MTCKTYNIYTDETFSLKEGREPKQQRETTSSTTIESLKRFDYNILDIRNSTYWYLQRQDNRITSRPLNCINGSYRSWYGLTFCFFGEKVGNVFRRYIKLHNGVKTEVEVKDEPSLDFQSVLTHES